MSSYLNLGSGQTRVLPLQEESLWFKSINLKDQGCECGVNSEDFISKNLFGGVVSHYQSCFKVKDWWSSTGDTVIYAVTTATYVISAVCVFNYVLLQDAVRSTSEWSEIFSLDLIKLWALCSLAHRMVHEVFVTKTSLILFLLKNILSWMFQILSTIHIIICDTDCTLP